MFPEAKRFMNPGNKRTSRLLGWWYVCIALAFVLLAVRQYIGGAASTTVALRGVIALGFGALGWMTLKRR